ncbi:MAG: hypothetical protein AAB525_03970 [Patescibacteria group bacterium]
MPYRLNFYQIFRINNDESIEPLRIVRIGGIQFGPGVRFGSGVFFGGIDLTQYVGRDFQVEEQSGILIIIGIY